ncbi:MAG TPA: lipid II flippase MurJ [Pyrinomonadaceae bacterium]|nr:lipid II flippase MurJ [Pyrinomonadaceae bacterium]
MNVSLTLACLAAVNVLLTLVIQWWIVTRLGLGIQTDALFAAIALPQLVLSACSNSLTLVLVPLLATEHETELGSSLWSLFLAVCGVFVLVALAFAVTAGYWVRWFVPGFSPEAQALTISITRIQMFTMILAAAAAVPLSGLQAKRKFVRVELSALASSLLSLMLLLWLMPMLGVVAAAWALGLRAGLQLAWLLPGIVRWQWPRWRAPTVLEARRRVWPLILGTTYYQADPLVDRFLTSMVPAGGLSTLYLGQQIYGGINLISDKALASPALPTLSIQAKSAQWRAFRSTFRKRLVLLGLMTGCGYLVLLVFGEPVLKLLIGYAGVSAENVSTLWWIMVALGGYFMAGAMGYISSKTFYAMGDTRTPTKLGLWTYTLFLPIKVVMFFRYGLIGLAVISSAFVLANLLLQTLFLENRLANKIDGKNPLAR